MSFLSRLGLLIGRILISVYFLWSGISKLLNYDESLQAFQALGIPQAEVWFLIFSIVEIVGGLAIFFGFFARFGAFLLILLLIPSTYFFLDFWNAEGEAMQIQKMQFLENLALLGGLFYVMSVGAGALSCVHSSAGKSKEQGGE